MKQELREILGLFTHLTIFLLNYADAVRGMARGNVTIQLAFSSQECEPKRYYMPQLIHAAKHLVEIGVFEYGKNPGTFKVTEDGWPVVKHFRPKGEIEGILFGVSNDRGLTAVCWRKNVHEALDYLDMQDPERRSYTVVATADSRVVPR